MGPKPPVGSGPLSFIRKSAIFWVSLGFSITEGEPSPPRRFTLSGYIFNIRPHIDLNLFMSVFNP